MELYRDLLFQQISFIPTLATSSIIDRNFLVMYITVEYGTINRLLVVYFKFLSSIVVRTGTYAY